MTLTLLDVLAYVSLTLVIALALTGGVIVYVRKLHHSIMQAIASLQRTDSTIADEQHSQTGLLQRITEILTIANKPRLLQETAHQRGLVVQQELARFLINSGRLQTVDEQTRLMLYLPTQVRTLIDQGRYPTQSAASLLTTIVQAAAEYSALPALAAGAQLVFNGSMTGRDFTAHCAYWQIPLPPKEGEPDAT